MLRPIPALVNLADATPLTQIKGWRLIFDLQKDEIIFSRDGNLKDSSVSILFQ